MKKIMLALLVGACCYAAEPKRFLVFGGKTGWIGQKIVAILQQQGNLPFCAESRLEDRAAIEKEIAGNCRYSIL